MGLTSLSEILLLSSWTSPPGEVLSCCAGTDQVRTYLNTEAVKAEREGVFSR